MTFKNQKKKVDKTIRYRMSSIKYKYQIIFNINEVFWNIFQYFKIYRSIFNMNLSWYNHINSLLRKIYSCLLKWLYCSFMRIHYLLRFVCKLQLIKSVVLPHLFRGLLVFPKLHAKCARKLKIACNDCVYIIWAPSSILFSFYRSYKVREELNFLYHALSIVIWNLTYGTIYLSGYSAHLQHPLYSYYHNLWHAFITDKVLHLLFSFKFNMKLNLNLNFDFY